MPRRRQFSTMVVRIAHVCPDPSLPMKSQFLALCEVLHNANYAKLRIMQSWKPHTLAKQAQSGTLTLHNYRFSRNRKIPVVALNRDCFSRGGWSRFRAISFIFRSASMYRWVVAGS